MAPRHVKPAGRHPARWALGADVFELRTALQAIVKTRAETESKRRVSLCVVEFPLSRTPFKFAHGWHDETRHVLQVDGHNSTDPNQPAGVGQPKPIVLEVEDGRHDGNPAKERDAFRAPAHSARLAGEPVAVSARAAADGHDQALAVAARAQAETVVEVGNQHVRFDHVVSLRSPSLPIGRVGALDGWCGEISLEHNRPCRVLRPPDARWAA